MNLGNDRSKRSPKSLTLRDLVNEIDSAFDGLLVCACVGSVIAAIAGVVQIRGIELVIDKPVREFMTSLRFISKYPYF